MAKQAHLQAIISAVDRLTPTLSKIGVNTTKTKALMASLNLASFAKLRGTLNVVGKSVADVGGAVRGVTSQILPMAGLGAISMAGLGLGFLAASRGAMAYAGSVQDATDITGLANDKVQQWQGLFRDGGVGVEESTQAIVKFGEQARNAATGGNKSFHALLTKLRIPLRDVKGQLRPVNDLMLDFADGVAAQSNPITRNAVLIEAFGKSGAKMAPAFMGGAASMREMLAQQQSMGKVLDGGSISALDSLGKKMEESGVQMSVLSGNILARAAPAFDALFEKTQAWIAANREIISQRMGDVIGRVADRMTAWIESGGFERLGEQIRRIWSGLAGLVNMVGGLGTVFAAFGALLLAGPIVSLLTLGGAIGRLGLLLLPVLTTALTALVGSLGALFTAVRAGQVVMLGMSLTMAQLALVALPVVAIAAALAGVAYLIYRNWGAVAPFLAGVWESIKSVATVAWNVLRFLFSWSPLGIVVNNWGALTSWMSAFWGGLTGVVSAGLALVDGLLTNWGVYDTIRAVWDPVVSFLSGVWERIQGIVGPILGIAGRVAGALGGVVGQQFGEQASGQDYGPRFAAAPSAGDTPRLAPAPALAQLASRHGEAPRAVAQPSPLAKAGAMQAPARVQGEMRVRFENAPPGMRVDPGQTSAPGLAFNPDVGYRSMGAIG